MVENLHEFVERVSDIPDDVIMRVELPGSNRQAAMANGMFVIGLTLDGELPEIADSANDSDD